MPVGVFLNHCAGKDRWPRVDVETLKVKRYLALGRGV